MIPARIGYRVRATVHVEIPPARRSRCRAAPRAADQRAAADLLRPTGRHDRLSARRTVQLGSRGPRSGAQVSWGHSMTEAQPERPEWLHSPHRRLVGAVQAGPGRRHQARNRCSARGGVDLDWGRSGGSGDHVHRTGRGDAYTRRDRLPFRAVPPTRMIMILRTPRCVRPLRRPASTAAGSRCSVCCRPRTWKSADSMSRR